MADLWRFQAREIGDAQLTAEDEDAQLEAEKRVLANAEKLYTAARSAHDLLYEQEGAAETTLTAALKHERSWRNTTCALRSRRSSLRRPRLRWRT